MNTLLLYTGVPCLQDALRAAVAHLPGRLVTADHIDGDPLGTVAALVLIDLKQCDPGNRLWIDNLVRMFKVLLAS